MARRTTAVLAVLVLFGATSRAVQTDVDLRAIEEALTLGRTGIAVERTRFHDPYRIYIAKAPVDYIEIVTPFRRIVLAAQGRAAIGDRGYGQRQALDMLATTGDQLDVYVELTFHPQNNYIGVPRYDVLLLGARGTRIGSRSLDRVSRWTPRVEGLPPPVPTQGGILSSPQGQPLLGATVIAAFDVRALDPKGRYEVVVIEAGEERGRGMIDLGRLR